MSLFLHYGKRSICSVIVTALTCLVACNGITDQLSGIPDQNSGDSVFTGNKMQVYDTAGYKVYQTLKPKMLPGSRQVTIYLLQDKRLKGPRAQMHYYPDQHAAELKFTSDDATFDPDNPVYKPARMVIAANDGTVLSDRNLGVPCARLDAAYIDENRSDIIYLFTEDYSIGWGSYAGPVTFFVRFADTDMVNFNERSGFATTLKSGWAIRYTEFGMTVWSKRCRPADNDEFNIITEKAIWSTDSFTSVKAVRNGFWENEGDTGSVGIKVFFDSF